MNIGQFIYYYKFMNITLTKENFSSKNYTKNVAWKLVPSPFTVLKNLLLKGIWEIMYALFVILW